MPTEELRQALRVANVAGVETNFAEVLARMFDLPPPVMARIVYAIQHVKHPVTWHADSPEWVALIPDREVRDAIRSQANTGALRVYLRKMQLQGRQVRVLTKAMTSRDSGDICNGCPLSMSCVADSLSTPTACWDGEGPAEKWQRVTLVRVSPDNTVIVRADQPTGQHVLSVHDVEP